MSAELPARQLPETAEIDTRRVLWAAGGSLLLAQIPIDRAMAIIAREGTQAYAPLIASEPALSSSTAGAERAITPDGKSAPAAATMGHSPSEGIGGASPAISDPKRALREDRK
jgi:hypothetical protein